MLLCHWGSFLAEYEIGSVEKSLIRSIDVYSMATLTMHMWGIILGGKCPGGNCSRWNFLGAVVRGAVALGGNCPGDTFPGGNIQGRNYQVSLLLPMKLFNIKEGKTSLHIRSRVRWHCHWSFFVSVVWNNYKIISSWKVASYVVSFLWTVQHLVEIVMLTAVWAKSL